MKRSLILVILVGIAVSANVQAQCGPPLPTPRVAFVEQSGGTGLHPLHVHGHQPRYVQQRLLHAVAEPAAMRAESQLGADVAGHLQRQRRRLHLRLLRVDGQLGDGEADVRRYRRRARSRRAFYITLDDRLCHQTKKSNVAAIP